MAHCLQASRQKVAGDRLAQKQPLAFAVVGSEHRAGPDRPLRRAEAHGAAGDRYVTACVRNQTRKRPQDLARARAHLARDGDDLAAARAQSEIRNMSWHGKLVDDDEALAGFVVAPLDFAPLGDLAEHELDDALSIHFGGGLRGDHPAVPQHRHARAQIQHLAEPMRDEDDAASRAGQFPHAGEDALNLALAKSRRRLVEDQDACVAAERARDLHQLALGHGEILHHGVGPHVVEAKSRQQALDLAPIICARAEIGANSAEQDVLQHRQRRHEAEFLFDHRDAGCLRLSGVRQRDRRPVDQDLSLIGGDDAGKRLDERALAGAVVSNQGVNFAPAQRERYAVERDDRPERLGDATHLQRQRRIGH